MPKVRETILIYWEYIRGINNHYFSVDTRFSIRYYTLKSVFTLTFLSDWRKLQA